MRIQRPAEARMRAMRTLATPKRDTAGRPTRGNADSMNGEAQIEMKNCLMGLKQNPAGFAQTALDFDQSVVENQPLQPENDGHSLVGDAEEDGYAE